MQMVAEKSGPFLLKITKFRQIIDRNNGIKENAIFRRELSENSITLIT
jgi:hypothetical protein